MSYRDFRGARDRLRPPEFGFQGGISNGYVYEVCPGDTDGNGAVDLVDLINILSDWGTDGSANGGDVDYSFDVDVDDLEIVILEWGQCPCDGCAPTVSDLCEEFENAGLSEDDCEDFLENLDDDNYICWTLHYLTSCGPTCTEPPDCPGSDPYGGH